MLRIPRLRLVLEKDVVLRNTLSLSKLSVIMPIRGLWLHVSHLKSIKLRGLVGFQPTQQHRISLLSSLCRMCSLVFHFGHSSGPDIGNA